MRNFLCYLLINRFRVRRLSVWAAALINPDIINCFSVAYKKIDKLLNEQYKALMLELDSPLGEVAERCKARMQFQMPIY